MLAIRVQSFGGSKRGPPIYPNGSFPGGLYDDPVMGNHDARLGLGLGLALNFSLLDLTYWSHGSVRVGPFDPAVSPGAHEQAYTLGGKILIIHIKP